MNRDIAQGQWKQIKGKVREQWGRLTNDDVDLLEGRYDRLVGKIQEKYGRGQEDAEREVSEFLESIGKGDIESPRH